MSDGVVLDASAILALLNDEQGASTVAVAMTQSVVSAVNLSEVAAKLSKYGMDPRSVRKTLAELDLEVIPFDEDQALSAAALGLSTKGAGLSLGDRACLALALAKGWPALSADRIWATIDVPDLEIRLIR